MRDKQTAKVTINEVAAHAGVSKSTVSRYINGKIDAISPKKVKSIKKAIEELNYRPSQMAQGLKVKKQGYRIFGRRYYKPVFSRHLERGGRGLRSVRVQHHGLQHGQQS